MGTTTQQHSPEIEARMRDEYRVLREELKINRRFVFERPLLIVGVSFVAMFNISFERAAVGIPESFFIVILFYNLWFTSNRLRSSARILGYLQIYHEGARRGEWKGWERSLSEYRSWCLMTNEQAKAKPGIACEESIKKSHRGEPQYDNPRFYAPIFGFHIIIAAFAAAKGAVPWIAGASGEALYFSVYSVVVFVFAAGLALWRWLPRKLKNLIEAETEIWEQDLVPQSPSGARQQPASAAKKRTSRDTGQTK